MSEPTEPGDEVKAEIDTLLDPDYAAHEKAQHLTLLQRVLEGLEAIEVASTEEERRAALEALPEETGQDDELDALLAQLKSSSLYMSDFGMTLKIAIGRAQYVRQLVAPTKLGTKLPFLYADDPAGEAGGGTDTDAATDTDGSAAAS
jgi:hypothetical protein